MACNKDATASLTLDELCYEVRETLRMKVVAFAASASVVWGASTISGTSVVWGASVPWNDNLLSAFSVVWGASTSTSTSATSVVWGASVSSADAAFSDAGDDEQ